MPRSLASTRRSAGERLDCTGRASHGCGIIGVTSMPLAPGTRLGAHEILSAIGAGGMGLSGAAMPNG